jgi:HAD superfamily hydrolase (TIGR01549 family)
MTAPRFRGLIFDMDGTLTLPALDFPAIRHETGIVAGDLVEEIAKLPPEARQRAWAVVEAHEARALDRLRLQEGARELLQRCRREAVRLGIVTRNLSRSVEALCRACGLRFDAVVTREFPLVKPHPGPVLHILEQWGVPPAEVLMIGDYVYDIASGRAAGTPTCYFHNAGAVFYGEDADFAVGSMAELERLVFPAGA